MTHRVPVFILGAAIAATGLASCSLVGPGDSGQQPDEGVEGNYPPIDISVKYFKPGPPLATTDEAELDRRFAYHQKVIDAYDLSYTIDKNEMTQHELADITGFVKPDDVGEQKPQKPPKAWDITLPPKWDWREQGVGLPPARQQGSCGSCWAFGTTAALEGAIAAFDQQLVNLSEQHVLDCSNKGSCGGGWWAYSLFLNHGAIAESEYPYKAYDQYCQQNGKAVAYSIESYHDAQSNVEAMKAAIFQHGGIGVTMAVCGSISGYNGGIYDSYECNYKSTNHIVALVGWDDTVQHSKGSGVWVMRNSWGTGWGEDGYGYFAYGTAKLHEDPTYVVYQAIDPTDTDEDGIIDLHDNCKDTPNADQLDADHDGKGDVCDGNFDPYDVEIKLTDDDTRKLDIGFVFPFFSTGYLEMYVNSDGNITFVEADKSTGKRDATRLLTGAPRIAPIFADLNPGNGGKVSWGKTAPDEVYVKWDQVPRYNNDGKVTAKVTMKSTGDIVFEWGDVTGPGYVVGVSKGGDGNLAGEVNLEGGLISFKGTTAMYEAFNSSKPFDLASKTLTLTPNNGPAPPPSEVSIPLGDDDTKQITFGFEFPFFGKTYQSVFVNSDGNLTFGQGDVASAKRDTTRFLTGAPRIGALFADLDPSKGGAITFLQTDSSLTVSYKSVKLYGKSQTATVKVELHKTGQIDITPGQVGGSSYIVGISEGGQGNSASEQVLSSMGLPIGYNGSDTIFQRFGDPEPFDLFGKTVTFVVDGGVDPPPPPPDETFVTLGDDDTAAIPIGFDFPFYGESYNTVYANSDGNLTLGQGDAVTATRNEERFLGSKPRIALFYADLDPSSGGAVSYRSDDPSTLTISYVAVPVWSQGGSNTARVTLQLDGTITLAYDGVTLQNAIIGVSQGGKSNSASGTGIDALIGANWPYGGVGAVFASYGSSDPFVLTGKTVTFQP